MRPKEISKLSPKSLLLLVIQIVLAGLAVCIAVWQIGRYTNSLRVDILASGAPWLIVSGCTYIVFYAVLAMHWQYISRQVEPQVSNKQWLAFFAAQPYKYLPTSLFTLTFRAKYASKLGMGVKKSSLAQGIENVSMLASATALALSVWLGIHNSVWLGILVFLACAVCFVLGFELLAKVKRGIYLPIRKRMAIFTLSLAAWVIAGLAFYIVVAGLNGVTGVLNAVGANAAAFEAGILAIFAPGGIGIRELVFGLFNIGALSIVVWRLITAVVDVIVGPVSWITIRKLESRKDEIS